MSSHFVPLCFLCGAQAPLETCKADEYGRPVHEECYVARLVLQTYATPPKKLPCQVQPRAWREFERWHAAETAMIPQREQRFLLPMSRRGAEVAVVVAALVVAFLIAYNGRRPSLPGPATLQASIGAGRRLTSMPATGGHVNRASTPRTMPFTGEKARSVFKRVQVGENEVDYVADDVTMRYFTYSPEVQRVRAGYRRFDIGEDVTVRYFPHDAAVVSATRPASNMAHPEDRPLPGSGKPASSKLAR